MDSPNVKLRAAFCVAALALSFAFSLWHRTQVPMETLDGRFTGNDAYFYFRQAERIVEEGKLPKRDMERWLPLGRDASLQLNLYSYMLAYSYRAARVFAPRLTLYEFSCYAPAVLFALTSVLFTAALWTCFGWETAGVGSLFFIMTPAIASRTTLGFADRDAFCLFLAVLAGALYLWKIRAASHRKRVALSALTGLAASVGCFSWEGFGVFVLCLIIPEMFRSLWPKHVESGRSIEFAAFCVCLTLPLLTLSLPHRFWANISEPVSPIGWIAVFPALCALSIILIRAAFQNNRSVWLKLASFLPVLILLGCAANQALASAEAAASFAKPFRGRLMETITELRGMSVRQWRSRFGALPMIAAISVVGSGVYLLWKRISGKSIGDCSSGMLSDMPDQAVSMVWFGTAWIALWGYLTHGSLRYGIMLAPAVAAWSAVGLATVGDAIQRRLQTRPLLSEALRYLFIALLPASIFFWPTVGGFAYQGASFAVGRSAKPSSTTHKAFQWMSENLSRNDGKPVVAARWVVGGQLNAIADVSTIEDPDTWKHYWIHLSSRHLFCAESELEALQFLKTRDADYWMLMRSDLNAGGRIAWIGSSAVRDRNIGFSRRIWSKNGSGAFEQVFENSKVKIFRIRYPPDLTVPPELYEAWTAPDFPDPELRRVWMRGK